MKRRNLPYRILSAAICFAIVLQGGIVMPAFADGTSFTYRLNYSEDACIEENTHPIIIPESDIDAEYGPETHSNFNSVVEGISITTGNTISKWGPEPYRIIGYTFDGWYTAENGTGTKIDEDTIITDDMLDSNFSSLSLYGNWIEYNSPDITSNSVTFNAKNANSEDISDQVILTDVNGNQIAFDSEVTDYYANVYGSTAYVNMSFEQYEPDAVTTVTVNGTDVTKTKEEYVTGTGYWYNETTTETPVLEAHTVNTGKEIETDYMPLDFTSDENEYNEICVTVTMPNYNQKTYTFYIKRIRKELKVSYGNTPYGVIMGTSSDIYTDENKATLKALFDSTLKKGSAYYSSNAWNIYGDEGVEVKKGTALTGTQYINYDKDETAIVVFMGSSFTDPGVTLYDENGNEIALSTANPITRTINYETVPSLKLSDWDDATPRTDTTTLTGAEGENVIDILKNGNVKPGIYTIEYSYDDEIPMKATRNMIVLPKPGDLNMDNYVNALDALAYDSVPDDNIDLSHNLYKYRVLDINDDGTVDDADATYFSNRLSILSLYSSDYSVNEDVTQPSYTAPDSASDSKAQLYMDFLGTDSANIGSPADNTQELEEGDILWIGYRFNNTTNLNASGDLNTITISVDYDSRYFSLNTLTTTALITKITKANPNLEVFDFTGATNYKGAYSVDSSTAAYTWNTDNNTAQVKTLILELHLKEGENFPLTDGYFIKIPFKVETVPPADGRSVITTKLGANSFNMNIGGTDYMWDTSNSLTENSVTKNLMSVLEYMGDYVPCFTEEAPATPLADATYGSDISYSGLGYKAIVEGDLPPGLTYTSATGTITGIPKEAGTFTFYVSGVKYSITVNKAELKVTANDAEKIYGGDNPALTFSYDETCLRNDDTIADAVQTAPTAVCDADETTPCQSNYPITFEEGSGESDNYYFTFVPGNLTITPKTINITSVKIPECSINATFPYTFSATASGSDIVSGDIINNDNIMISYDVTYNDTEATKAAGDQKSVTVGNISIISDESGYESGKNYILADDTKLDLNTGAIVADSIKDFEITEYCQLEYTYGEPLDLDTGNIKITYDSGIEVNATFAQAKDKGITISYKNSGKEAQNGDKLKVSDSGDYLILTFGTTTQWTNTISVSKKDLHITADNKVRYYGDENSACHTDGDTDTGFTYSFTLEDIVTDYGDTTTNIAGYIEPTFSCDAKADTEIDKEKGYTEAEIELSGGSADNYNIICTNGTLTINKRPLTITGIISDVPALTAAYYMNNDGSYKAAPYKVEASAVAGTLADGATASMTVSNLYNDDPVKINYNAQYANYTVTDSVSVIVEGIEMEDSYGKSYNYTVASDSTTSAEGGRVYERNIKEIEVTESPTTDYTYGTPLDLDTGNIHIVYDSGQEYNITFNELADHPDLKLVYSNTTDEVVNETQLQVSDSGNSMTLTADSIYDEVNDFSWTSEKFEIEPHELHVSADSLYTTYGEDITEYTSGYTYTYTESDFQYSETEDSAVKTKPTIVCKEDDGTTDANQKTLAGVYTMRISGGEADNYKFVYTNGTLTIRQRPLVITGISNIPTLSAKDAYYQTNLSSKQTVETDKNPAVLTFGSNQGPLWDDKVRISYTVTYPDPTAIGETDVNISKAELDKTYGDARNYYLQKTVSTQTGVIDKAIITNIEITADPTKNADGTVKEYSYGDTLDLSGGRYEITFDSGRVDSNVTLDELKDYGITATYTGTNDEVEDGVFVTIDDYNSKSITLTPPGDATAETAVTGEIKVNKRKMHVIVNNSISTYGDEPKYTLDYTQADFADGETELTAFGDLIDGFVPPALSCEISGEDAGITTPAGTYENAITASGGESHNYEFVCDDTGTLTINKRELTIETINSSVPMLTTALIKQNNSQPPIEISAAAVNSDMTLSNLANEDSIGITYTAVYSSVAFSSQATVSIKNVMLDEENYPLCSNYTLVSSPSESVYGSIQEPKITGIEVVSDPAKMEYNYGEAFILSGGNVNITYNEEYVVNTTFDKLSDYGINLTFEKNGETVKNNSILTVANHNGYRIILTADGAEDAYTGEMIVHKHTMRVMIEDKSFTYGDEVPEYTFYYNSGDLVNGDSLESANFKSGLAAPELFCMDGEEEITSTSDVGEYVISGRNASSDNYDFEYVPAVMTVNRRPLNILSIDSGIPVLTSDIILRVSGTTHRLSGIAANDDDTIKMTVSNLIGEDSVKITYTAVYTSVTPDDNAEVGIENIAIDDTYGKSKNYSVGSVTDTANGGVIKDGEIEAFEILQQPVLEYTYGNTLNLNGGRVRITYDSGLSEEMKFNELPVDKAQLLYTGTTDTAADGDVLNVNYHNGRTITISAISPNTVTPVETKPLIVHKKRLNIDADDVVSTYGNTFKLTWNYRSEDFENGESASSETFRNGLTEPLISCVDENGREADNLTNAGAYTITLSGGSADNYEFVYNDALLTIERRPMDVNSIDSGVPVLTSRIIYEQPANIHRLEGSAVNTENQMSVANVVNGDIVKITYTAVYTGTSPADEVNVNIENVALDDSYEKSANYKLEYVTMKSKYGCIKSQEISQLVLTAEPKLEYTYGEPLDLSGGKLKIVYDSGYYVKDVSFDDLGDYGVDLTYSDTGNTAASGDKLTVLDYNGKIIVLTPQTKNQVQQITIPPIKVNKKRLDVNANRISSVYGETPVLTFSYDKNDFEYGETETSADFIDGLTEPTVQCLDGAEPVGAKSGVGNYTITVSGGEANNYEFVYHKNTLTVTRRPIEIKAINDGVPPLTSDIIYQQPGNTHVLSASAVNDQMEVSNVINNDLIRVKYDAVYTSVEPTDEIVVNIENAVTDDSYEQSKNYYVSECVSAAPHGRIYDSEIMSVEITEQPQLEYIYGDTLDLSGGSVKITYDSGLVKENLTFDELKDYGIKITYTGTWNTAASGDVLTVLDHNGKTLTLTAETVYDVMPVNTDVISVSKRVLEYGDCTVNPIIYDGSTTETTGTIVFTNVQNGDNVTATAAFTFEDCNAGKNKTVYITDIKLDDKFTANYELSADNITAVGEIEKAQSEPLLTAENIELSELTNAITITAPAMSQTQIDGGAEYEYSIDGGETWHKSNVFENLAQGLECQVCIRFAETDNYKQSAATEFVDIKTYINKVTVIAKGDEQEILSSFYTNITTVNDETELRTLIGDVGVDYYQFYTDTAGKTKLTFPLTLTEDVVIYASQTKSTNKSSRGGGINVTPTPTVLPTSTPISTEMPISSIQPDETAKPSSLEPYMSGYDGMIKPDDYMTRAEAATIMVQLSGDTEGVYENVFPDVGDDTWYEKYISQANSKGLISGFDDGLFRPEDTLTREQYASMIARLIKLEPVSGVSFEDVDEDRWSAGYINAAVECGIISGYEDGTFAPENPIRRSEAVRMTNAATGRIPDKAAIDKIPCPFIDLPKEHWAYYELMIASCEY